MKLTQDQQKLFENWLRQKIEHSSCTLCQANRWKVGELIVPHVIDAVDDLSVTVPHMVQLICKNCGHILLFDTHYIKDWHETSDLSQSGLIM
jgi:hypothetical protein